MLDQAAAPGQPYFLRGGGEMGARIRAHDWVSTPLGSPEAWPQSLRTLVSVMLAAEQPMFIAWGSERRLLFNDNYAPILGHRCPSALGRRFFEVWPEVEGELTPLVERVFAGEPVHMDDITLLLDRPGRPQEAHFAFSYTPVRDDKGVTVGLFCACTETTEQVLAGRRRADERERFAQLFDQAPTFMATLRGPDHRFELANPGYMRLIGGRQVLGKTVAEALPEAVEQGYMDLLDDVYRSGRPYTATGARFVLGTLSGCQAAEHYIDFVYQPIVNPEGRVTGVFVVGVDVTARTQADAALRESRDRLAAESHALEVLNRIGPRVATELDLATLVQVVVDAGVDLTGAQFGAFFYNVLTDSGERYMLFALAGAERSAFERFGMPRPTAIFAPTFHGEGVIRSGDILKDERYGKNAPHAGMPEGHIPVRSYLSVPVISRSGEVIGGLMFGHPEPDRFSERSERLMAGLAAQAAIGIDNARLFEAVQRSNAELERRVAERTAELETAHAALRQSQKMEAVGQLTGGIAHDFNNLLTGITGSLELLQTRVAQGRINDLNRYIVAARGAADRAAALTHRLLAFSRRQTLDPKPIDANRLVAGMEELVRRTVGPAVTVEVVAAGGLWTTMVDPSQLESALLNLCINSRDAMPEGGRLTIETANRWLDERAARTRELPPGQYVSLCVSDTGTGMTPDTAARAFDPFFTTKPIGMGTGLGLSMIYGFVRQSGGQARIYSEPGQGTTVCLYLPRHLGEAEEAEPSPDLMEAPRAGQGETVLVVDDEPTVRMLVAEVLEELGYAAIEAADGASGLNVLRSDVRLDLLITDVGLPGGMNGRQVADAARAVRPDLKVLFITGYAENAVLSHGHLVSGMHVLTKPFAMEALASRIKAIIVEN